MKNKRILKKLFLAGLLVLVLAAITAAQVSQIRVGQWVYMGTKGAGMQVSDASDWIGLHTTDGSLRFWMTSTGSNDSFVFQLLDFEADSKFAIKNGVGSYIFQLWSDGDAELVGGIEVANGDMSINDDGSVTPASIADASAPNDSIYYSTTQSKLVYKDSGGTVHALY